MATEHEINNPDLEAQYKLYLGGMELTEEQMHPQQRIQLKQAFMAGCGQVLLLLRNVTDARGPEAARITIHDLVNQVLNYWDKEIGPNDTP